MGEYNKENKRIKVSNHAIVRYFERILKYDFGNRKKDIDKIILLSGIIDLKKIKSFLVNERISRIVIILGGNCHMYFKGEYKYIFDEYVLKTVIDL